SDVSSLLSGYVCIKLTLAIEAQQFRHPGSFDGLPFRSAPTLIDGFHFCFSIFSHFFFFFFKQPRPRHL
ncbi:Uncharacterized protein APZ42_008422, partial [Daphnia magna]